MPTLFQSIQGFAGASGVGVLCLAGLFLAASVFANNLPVIAKDLLASPNWSAVANLPLLVVAYVIGLLAIAFVDGGTRLTSSGISALSNGAVAARYGQLEQEAEILSGSVVGFFLLGVAALLNMLGVSRMGSHSVVHGRIVRGHRGRCLEDEPNEALRCGCAGGPCSQHRGRPCRRTGHSRCGLTRHAADGAWTRARRG